MTGLAAVLKNADDFVAEGRTAGRLRRRRMQHGALPCGDERKDEGGRYDDTAHVGRRNIIRSERFPEVKSD